MVLARGVSILNPYRLAVSATAMASLTPGSSVPQSFDHLADRNLALIRKHADALVAEARSPFQHGGKPDDVVD